MLTAELVHARRRKGTLTLTKLGPERVDRALRIATDYYELALANVELTREELEEAWRAVSVPAADRKLADGLKKLVSDGLEFAVCVDEDPVELRRAVFERATARRKALGEDERFDAGALLHEVATERGIDSDALLRGLYGDLKGAHVLNAVTGPPPRAIVESYDLEQARAVLLRATRVRARIEKAKPDAIRALFRKLSFHRLLYSIRREPDGAYLIELDGPFSLFDSVTKYGLALALALPAITACGKWSIEADVRWGKRRDPLTFRLEGARDRSGDDVPTRLRDEVQELVDRWPERSPWRIGEADEILDLPGVGLCVPDVAFTHAETGEVVLLEVLGFWSRDAVWKRVELVEGGLGAKILFAVSSRLRVSEAVLPDDVPGALYVFKGKMSCKQVEDRLAALLER
ncbi:MAG: DUF790 family protein [Sandaracinaceae bacterium]|nr:DUF790 family protein [Sandaracinaceae bacterium]